MFLRCDLDLEPIMTNELATDIRLSCVCKNFETEVQ